LKTNEKIGNDLDNWEIRCYGYHMRSPGSYNRLALVSTPWPLYNRPSIQLGVLKAYLKACYPDLQVTTYHHYLDVAAEIGYRVYGEVSQRMWLAEPVYAALLNPGQLQAIRRLFRKQAGSVPLLRHASFSKLLQAARKATENFVARIPWRQFGLVGFSISLNQLASALYVIRCIKTNHPNVPMILGGASLAGDCAQDLLDAYPEIDGAVIGEGEYPLAAIAGHLKQGGLFADLPLLPGIVTRHAPPGEVPSGPSQVADLDQLPVPDYSDYCEHIQALAPERRFFPVLSAEMSRGCWWQKMRRGATGSGCAFCNLNLQWQGYRAKSPSKVVEEVDHLTAKYRSLSIAFMDNVLPRRNTRLIFERMARLKKDLALFAEIRSGVGYETLNAMRAAGVRELQIGIEALSSRLLRKLNKGTRCIDNLEMIKNCEEVGIVNLSNLITHFPGSDSDDVAETLRAIEFARPFRPLKTVRFWLGRGSPVSSDPASFGIQAVFNHPHYAVLFPSEIVSRVRFMVQAYRGDVTFQDKLWRPVIKQVKAWERQHAALRPSSAAEPLLGYRDGQEFLIIFQRRAPGETATHRLTGTSRRIYLFCRRQRTLQTICRTFPGYGEDKIRAFLRSMEDKNLMFGEKERYLSLAVRSR
jgi:ribosomal peptide maturation radical SAM protein 1